MWSLCAAVYSFGGGRGSVARSGIRIHSESQAGRKARTKGQMNPEQSWVRLEVCPWRLLVERQGVACGTPPRTVSGGSLHSDGRTSDLRWKREHPLGAM